MANTSVATISHSKRVGRIKWTVAIILAVFWLLVTFVPFLFMVITGFKQKLETIMYNAFHMPEKFYPDNYISILTDPAFWTYFKNSVIVLVLSLVLLLFISACAAYPLSRFKFKMRAPIYGAIVAAMSVPMHVTLRYDLGADSGQCRVCDSDFCLHSDRFHAGNPEGA